MTQTIEQAGRPIGHPGYCACPECFQWHQQNQSSTKAQWNELVLTPTEQTTDYLRIHWWVRLFGFVWLVIPAVMTIVLVAFMLGAMANNTTGG